MDYDAYLTDTTAYETTLKSSIAATMDGVSADDVYDLVVTAARRLMHASDGGATLKQREHVSMQSVGAVSISYKIMVRDAELSYASLASQLQTAISSGEFDSVLQTIALDNGATGLASATSAAVITVDRTPTSTPSASPTEAPTNAEELAAEAEAAAASILSTGALIGIIAGGIAIVGLLVGVCYVRGRKGMTGTLTEILIAKN
jgi:hypothetical protein